MTNKRIRTHDSSSEASGCSEASSRGEINALQTASGAQMTSEEVTKLAQACSDLTSSFKADHPRGILLQRWRTLQKALPQPVLEAVTRTSASLGEVRKMPSWDEMLEEYSLVDWKQENVTLIKETGHEGVWMPGRESADTLMILGNKRPGVWELRLLKDIARGSMDDGFLWGELMAVCSITEARYNFAARNGDGGSYRKTYRDPLKSALEEFFLHIQKLVETGIDPTEPDEMPPRVRRDYYRCVKDSEAAVIKAATAPEPVVQVKPLDSAPDTAQLSSERTEPPDYHE